MIYAPAGKDRTRTHFQAQRIIRSEIGSGEFVRLFTRLNVRGDSDCQIFFLTAAKHQIFAYHY